MRSAAQRRLGPFGVAPIGLGCMNLSHAYGHPPLPEAAERLLLRAVDLGVTYFDTAALYGFGRNEELLGRALAPHRAEVVLASKCGLTGVGGQRVLDGRPETLERTCEESLVRLRTDVIDLYYLHRWDKRVPIEESVGALAKLARAGKIRAIGLSEVSVATLKKAHAVHPVTAVQSEYSLFTRDPERGLLAACDALGTAVVAFSPLGRGLLGGGLTGAYAEGDIRRSMPRFNPPHLAPNLVLARAFSGLAPEAGCTPAQLALAWLMRRAPHVIPIPGTTSEAHLEDNVGACRVRLSGDLWARVEASIDARRVSGARYPEAALREIDADERRPS